MTNVAAIILTSRNPIGVLEGYLAAGFLRPIDDFVRGQQEWISSLTGGNQLRYRNLMAGTQVLRELELEHGVGAAIDLDHPFTIKMLRVHQRKPFLPEMVLSNARTYQSNHRSRMTGEALALQ
ncbi:hypothetical protein [Rhizobium phaseoli]|uniref:hypothetical protein n=1 Tax=Rhizobium phaseoli TaxID=396 RepID=UPI0011433BFB|nr:hypothetical protein [Rhizobium phaseoli]